MKFFNLKYQVGPYTAEGVDWFPVIGVYPFAQKVYEKGRSADLREKWKMQIDGMENSNYHFVSYLTYAAWHVAWAFVLKSLGETGIHTAQRLIERLF